MAIDDEVRKEYIRKIIEWESKGFDVEHLWDLLDEDFKKFKKEFYKFSLKIDEGEVTISAEDEEEEALIIVGGEEEKEVVIDLTEGKKEEEEKEIEVREEEKIEVEKEEVEKRLSERVRKAITVAIAMILIASAGIYYFFFMNQEPIAKINCVSEAMQGKLITFDAKNSTDNDGKIKEYRWDFGDGTKGYGDIATHIYLKKGSYTVTLTVKDDEGGIGKAKKRIEITSFLLNVPEKKIKDEGSYNVYGHTEVWNNDTGLYTYQGVQTTPIGNIPILITFLGISMEINGVMSTKFNEVGEAEDGFKELHRVLSIATKNNLKVNGNITTKEIGKVEFEGTVVIDDKTFQDLYNSKRIKEITNSSSHWVAKDFEALGIDINSQDDLRSYPDLTKIEEQFSFEDIYENHIFDFNKEETLSGTVEKGGAFYSWEASDTLEEIYNRGAMKVHITIDQNTMNNNSWSRFYIDFYLADRISMPVKSHVYLQGKNDDGTEYLINITTEMSNYKRGDSEIPYNSCQAEHYKFNLSGKEDWAYAPNGTSESFMFSAVEAVKEARKDSDIDTYLASHTDPYVVSAVYGKVDTTAYWNLTFGAKGEDKGMNINITYDGSEYKVKDGKSYNVNISKPKKSKSELGEIYAINSAEDMFKNDPEINNRFFSDGKIDFSDAEFGFRTDYTFPTLDLSAVSTQSALINYAYFLSKEDNSFTAVSNAETGQLMFVLKHSGDELPL